MKDFNNIAKRNELEELCRLFIDGRLSVEEENDLALVLSYSQERGGIIDETIFLLGLERIVKADKATAAEDEKSASASARRHKNGMAWTLARILKVSACAAVVMVLVSVVWNMAFPTSSSPEENKYAVFIEGKEVSDKATARRIAQEEYEKSMRFLAEMTRLEDATIKEISKMNEIYDKAMSESKKALENNNING
ncbi:MAG: hypothetical protein K1W02_03555 [Muribaculaceae bacterium]